MTSTAVRRGSRWVVGARPRTLPASVAPVLVGIAAVRPGAPDWARAALCAAVAVSLQVGTNYANDYADGVRGTDERRVGPVRLVASGLATPREVRRAALASFGVAAAAGGTLCVLVSWWLVPVGLAAIAAGWGYTGGPRPYGYAGLGEPFVFAFFGLVATAGTAYCCGGGITSRAGVAGAAMGLLACALLSINNLRDLHGDAAAGKRTLAVRLGRRGAAALYAAELLGGVALAGACAAWRPAAAVSLAAAALAVRPLRAVSKEGTGAALLPALADTARVQLAVGVLLAVGLWL